MDNEKLIAAIEDAIFEKDGMRKLACAKALKISADLDVSSKLLTEYCNANDIKISDCQLGCFE